MLSLLLLLLLLLAKPLAGLCTGCRSKPCRIHLSYLKLFHGECRSIYLLWCFQPCEKDVRLSVLCCVLLSSAVQRPHQLSRKSCPLPAVVRVWYIGLGSAETGDGATRQRQFEVIVVSYRRQFHQSDSGLPASPSKQCNLVKSNPVTL